MAMATGLLRNSLAEPERVYLATFADGDRLGAAVLRESSGLWIGASDSDAAVAFAEDLFAQQRERVPVPQGVVGIPVGLRCLCASVVRVVGQTA